MRHLPSIGSPTGQAVVGGRRLSAHGGPEPTGGRSETKDPYCTTERRREMSKGPGNHYEDR
jgi:hypothetical protein